MPPLSAHQPLRPSGMPGNRDDAGYQYKVSSLQVKEVRARMTGLAIPLIFLTQEVHAMSRPVLLDSGIPLFLPGLAAIIADTSPFAILKYRA